MNKGVIIGVVGAVVGIGVLMALSNDDESARDATAKTPGWKMSGASFPEVAALPNMWTEQAYVEKINELVSTAGKGQSQLNLNTYNGVPGWVRELERLQKDTWAARSKPLTAQVETKESPAYIELYRGPWVPVYLWEGYGWRWTTRNRYGMPPAGASVNLWGLALTTAGYVLPMVPGVGTAANAALQAAVALGQGKSLKEAGLAAIRGTLPAWGQVAFDLGVGVALQGKSIDQAAIDAGLEQLEVEYPGARSAYEQGKQAYKDLG